MTIEGKNDTQFTKPCRNPNDLDAIANFPRASDIQNLGLNASQRMLQNKSQPTVVKKHTHLSTPSTLNPQFYIPNAHLPLSYTKKLTATIGTTLTYPIPKPTK